MEQLPHWLEAAVEAAGMTTVYNAEDWNHLDKGAAPSGDPSPEVPPTLY